MPKKKVDSQQGIRLELQESERDMLRFYTTSASVRNIGIGVGAVALPACIVAAGIFVAAIFDKGYDAITGDLRTAITERPNRRRMGGGIRCVCSGFRRAKTTSKRQSGRFARWGHGRELALGHFWPRYPIFR